MKLYAFTWLIIEILHKTGTDNHWRMSKWDSSLDYKEALRDFVTILTFNRSLRVPSELCGRQWQDKLYVNGLLKDNKLGARWDETIKVVKVQEDVSSGHFY